MRECFFSGTAAGAFMVLTTFVVPESADARVRLLDELRFGVFQHDTNLIGHQKETGVDFALELLSGPLVRSRLLGSPRLVIGGAVNSAGQTNQAYIGLVGRYDLYHDLFVPRDTFFVEGTVGGDWNDGKLNVLNTPLAEDWKSHGSHVLFRIGVGAGYRLNRTWSVAISFNHISNAGLAYPNEGMNDLGLLVGIRV